MQAWFAVIAAPVLMSVDKLRVNGCFAGRAGIAVTLGIEDKVLVEDMQLGISARPERTGTLFMDSENLIHHFESYLTQRVDYQP